MKALEIVMWAALAIGIIGALAALAFVIYIEWQSFTGKNPFQ